MWISLSDPGFLFCDSSHEETVCPTPIAVKGFFHDAFINETSAPKCMLNGRGVCRYFRFESLQIQPVFCEIYQCLQEFKITLSSL